jgi:hypothetical protein
MSVKALSLSVKALVHTQFLGSKLDSNGINSRRFLWINPNDGFCFPLCDTPTIFGNKLA